MLWEMAVRCLAVGRLRRLAQRHSMKVAVDNSDCRLQRWQQGRAVCGGGDGTSWPVVAVVVGAGRVHITVMVCSPAAWLMPHLP